MSVKKAKSETKRFMDGLRARNPHQDEFHQAAEEVVKSVMPYYLDHPEYAQAKILERMTEPDRIVSFRVCWEDDEQNVHVNRGWRVQFNNALGPYKGGLRLHPSVNESVLKFLGFEQGLKNALTGLPMGGGKGGSNFDPKGKSDSEVMRFCQSFMTELSRHIGEHIDVPAGDIGVGSREIGYLFGFYKRLRNRHAGVLTGKGLSYGGSPLRTEATGYGLVYLTELAMKAQGQSLEGKNVAISGSGNVAIYAAEKALACGASVITMSDSDGFIHDPDGLDEEKLAFVKELKEERGGRISEYADEFSGATFSEGAPWGVETDVALPCATQNEIDLKAAKRLVKNGCTLLAEGANMPTKQKASRFLRAEGVTFLPGKAANAGGVGVSGFELSQNAERTTWSREDVDRRLQEMMSEIHEKCAENGKTQDGIDYHLGANVAGFARLAKVMMAYGLV